MLESTPGQGSTFTLYLPRHHVPVRSRAPKETAAANEELAVREGSAPTIAEEALLAPLPNDIQDDRANLKPGYRIFLIVEDDITFASLLLDLAREQGFKGLIAFTGEAGLAMARKFRPQAISLDLRLPDVEGGALLDYLKHDVELRHIPVQGLSRSEEHTSELQSLAYLVFR